jgi:LacI family transcriptional regulator
MRGRKRPAQHRNGIGSEQRLKQPTLADVAERANVHASTVSRILTGVSVSRPRTRSRVLAAVAELGYRPSAIARSLRVRSSQTLGLIVSDVQNPYFTQLIQVIEDAARLRDLALVLCNGGDDPRRELGYLELLAERRADGVIVASSRLGDRHKGWLGQSPLAVILVNCNAGKLKLPIIRSDDRLGGRLVGQHLSALGHRRIGYISAARGDWATLERLAGLREAMTQAGLPDGPQVAEGNSRVSGGEKAALELLDREPLVTAIACHNDLTAIGAMRAVRLLGRVVPRNVSVTGFDDVELAAYSDPPLTTVRQDIETMGRWAVDQVVSWLNNGRMPAAIAPLTLPVTLALRESTAPPL